jgi:hypothetical protein
MRRELRMSDHTLHVEIGQLGEIPPVRRFNSIEDYRDFERAVRRELRYVRRTAHDDFLETVLATSHTRELSLKKGGHLGVLWRAQIGHDWREVEEDGHVYSVECPYPRERMKPIPDKVPDGRANPKAIPCLYLATTQETAVLEIRPLMGSYISVAQLKINRDLKIIDFSSARMNFEYTWNKKRYVEDLEKAVWADINTAFSRPVGRGDDSIDYIPTQILAELFKCNGFDGIGYKSSCDEDGFNVALFDLDVADVVNCALYRIDAISVKMTHRASRK